MKSYQQETLLNLKVNMFVIHLGIGLSVFIPHHCFQKKLLGVLICSLIICIARWMIVRMYA